MFLDRFKLKKNIEISFLHLSNYLQCMYEYTVTHISAQRSASSLKFFCMHVGGHQRNCFLTFRDSLEIRFMCILHTSSVCMYQRVVEKRMGDVRRG
jgi:hypothetical protein